MASPIGELAIGEVLRTGRALLKFISANDVGLTGGHQCGYYLPKPIWKMFTPHAPTKGQNSESDVEVLWQDDRTTQSKVKWYGKGTRSEYRLTRFGKDFPFLSPDAVGNLLVLVPSDHSQFRAFVLDLEDDIEEIQAALGLESLQFWGAYQDGVPRVETEDQCIEKRFRQFALKLATFPSGNEFSEETRATLSACISDFLKWGADDLLVRTLTAEYRLFRLTERQICQKEIVRVFKDVDDFLKTAGTIMNRRKVRAGRSLENHFEFLLKRSGIPHDMRPSKVPGRPDVVIPSAKAYLDSSFPTNELYVLGVKTTCKDRWRQILSEAPRVKQKHLVTLQQGISIGQLQEMFAANLTLVVPKEFHSHYPRDLRGRLLTIDSFLSGVKGAKA